MRQFDVFRNPDPASARRRPYLVVLQSDFLAVIDTVVVAPLAPASRLEPVERLTPVVDIAGTPHVVLVHELAAIPRAPLKRAVASAARKRDELVAALDLVFFGF